MMADHIADHELRELVVSASLDAELADPNLAADVWLADDSDYGLTLRVNFKPRDRWSNFVATEWTVPHRTIPEDQAGLAADYCQERADSAAFVGNRHASLFFTLRRLMILDQVHRAAVTQEIP